MDIDPIETATAADEDAHQAAARAAATGAAHDARLSSWVAVTVAILATFLGVCKVKDDNIVQAMQQAQADRIDHWSFYQARNIREEVAKATLEQLRLAAPSAPASRQAEYRAAIGRYEALVADQETKKEEVRKQAEDDAKRYDALNYRDDQFDLSDALIAIAISMLAVTALTHKRWLYWLALVPTFFGVLMGVAGLFGLHIHSDFIAQLLS